MRSRVASQKTPLSAEQIAARSLHLSDKEKILSIVGKRAKVKDHYHGKIIGLNTSPYGAFPASVYPIVIRLDKDFHGHVNKDHAFKFQDFVIEE